MHRYRRFGVLSIFLLIFSLVTGSIVPNLKIAGAVTACQPAPAPVLSDTAAAAGLNSLNNLRSTVTIWTVTSNGATITPAPTLALPTVVKDTGTSGVGAQNHAIYLANYPDQFPYTFETTTATNNCFTTQGNQAASVAARFAQAPSLSNAVNQAADSVYLRLPLIHPRLQKIGLGLDFDNSNRGKAVIDDSGALASDNYAATSSTPQFNNFIVGYPGTNATIPTTLPTGEGTTNSSLSRLAGGIITGTTAYGDYPDPITRNPPNLTNPVGYPISLLFDESNTFNVTLNTAGSFLTQVGAAANTAVSFIPPNTVQSVYGDLKAFGANSGSNTTPAMQAIIMIPNAPLVASATYQVTFAFTLTNGGAAQTLTWQFKTGSTTTGGTVTPGTSTAGSGTSGSGTSASGCGCTNITPVVVPTSSALTPTPTQGLPGAPNPPNQKGPTAFYTPTPADGQNPPQFFQVWGRVDDPVKMGLTSRSWLYGPLPYGFSILFENYEGGRRLVAYHDKARMEITNPNTGYVSNGLLVKELISGYLQLGDSKYDIRTASNQTVAGDPFELNPNTPSYAAFARVASLNNDKRSPDRTNQQVVETMTRDGTVNVNIGTASYGVTYSHYSPNLGHNIPDRFWNFMNQYGLVLADGYYNDTVFNWVSVMGLPISEPYWVQAVVGGQVKDVLVQVFERRVLTFTPSNSPAFQVEMGNVGRHYYQWRYGQNP